MSLSTKLQTGAAIALAGLTAACTTIPSTSLPDYVTPLDGASVIDNRTRYSQSLECLRGHIHTQPVAQKRFTVGRVSDFTGKEDLTNGKRITQGASLMVISALSRTGVPMVERFDTSIADMEFKYADNKLITDNPQAGTHRQLMSGSVPGSDYHVVGGVTEVNYNIRSGSFDSSLRFIGFGARYFVMNIGLDLRLVNTKTLEIVNTQSLQKQIIGTELSGGYFRLFSDGIADIASSERTQEPIQRGVRMVVEQAVFNMLTETFPGLPTQSCVTPLPGQQAQATGQQVAHAPAAAPAAAEAVPTAAVAPTNPILLTQPPSNSAENTGQAAYFIDPNTGEVVEAAQTATPPVSDEANAQSSLASEPVQGLFGGVGNTASPATSLQDSTGARSVMQERLLYGNRPMLR